MRLGVNLFHEGSGELARTAEDLGYEIAFAPEGYRSEAASVLGFAAARTDRIRLCGGVMQIPARPPALAALAVATIDALSGGRAIAGFGVSNPDVSDGWYGVPFDQPLGRTREYVEILRKAFAGGPVRHEGVHYRIPLTPPGNAPLQLMTEPLRADLPIYLAAIGPRNLQLAGEIADGWIGAFASPRAVRRAVDEIRLGRARAGRELAGFAVIPCVAASFAETVETAASALRAHFAYLMGIGDPTRNIYVNLARDLGFGDTSVIHELVQHGDRVGAAAAVPLEFIDELALLGPVDRVAGRMREYAAAGATTLSIMVSAAATGLGGRLDILRTAALALEKSGVND